MKKLIALSICVIMGALITGCGKKAESPSAIESSLVTGVSSNMDKYSETKTVDLGEKIKKTATVNETVIYDENDVVITVMGMDYLNNAVEIKFKIENNSDKDLSFTAGTLGYSANAINNYMTKTGYMSCDVAAGGSEEDFIDIEYSELVMHGIDELSEIQVGIRVSDDDFNDFITGPLQIKTSVYDESKYKDNAWIDTLNNSDYAEAYGFDVLYSDKKEIYNSKDVSVISEMYVVNKNSERMVIFEEKNATDNTVYVQTSEICINGIMVYDSTWTSDTITPHKNMVSNITIDDLANAEELAELGISEINNVSFKIRAIDREWNEVADASYVKIDIENGDSVAMESQDAIVKEIQKSESEVASSTVSEVKAETPEDSSAASEIDSAGIRPEIKEAIDSYETFMNDYCDFMKKYNESDDTTSMITEYADYMKKYADFTEKFDKIADEDLNAEETEYYTDTLTRVTKKLFETSDNADE